MHNYPSDPAIEVQRLQRSMNDLVSALALPALWSGSEPGRVVETFLDALVGMLDLDFLYVQVRIGSIGIPIEALKTAQSYGASHSPKQIRQALDPLFGEGVQRRITKSSVTLGDKEVSIYPLQMGAEGEVGLIVAGSGRSGFPEQTERLVLSVAANQAAIGLLHALRVDEQKRSASEVGLRVAERTRELVETNSEMEIQVGILQHLPVSAWTLTPDGTPDFVNRVWLEFSGQTLDFVRSHPEAWMTAIHPEDRERAGKSFWEAVQSGQGFAIETRSLRAQDGSYRWHLNQAVVLRDSQGNVLKYVGTTTDIDDQKRAEKLRASEEELRQILNSIPGQVCTLNPAGLIELANQPLTEYFGMTVEQLNMWEGDNGSVHPEDLPRVIAKFTHAMTTGTSYDIEVRYRRADGVYRWFQFHTLPVKDTQGAIIRWYCLIVDIEDRKRAEEAVQAGTRNLDLIINTIPMLAWSTGPDGFVEFLNQRWLDYAGMSAEEGAGWGWAAAIHPEDAKRLLNYWQAAMVSGTDVDVEARMRRFDGVYRWFLFRANPLRDDAGNILKWYGTNTDIDDRKRAEEALRLRELNLLQITETIPEMLWSATPDGAIDYCNGRLLEYTGFSHEDIMSDGWMKLLYPDDVGPAAETWKSCVESGTPYRVEVRTIHAADQTYRWCVTSALPLHDDDGHILKWHGTVVDMHDWKQAQEELRNTQSELARMMRVMTMGQLTASIAHEVSQPLSGIINNAGTCLRMLNSDPPNVDGARETTQRTIRDGHRATDVITRLRTLYSTKQINIESVDMNEATREVVALLLGELQKDGVSLQLQLSENLPRVMGDRVQLQQVILNLLRNASDAMTIVDDRPRQLIIHTDADGDLVRVSIQDSGVGFDPEMKHRLFQSFFTTKEEGMGIGLSVSRSIVEAHHGQLWAARNDGPGSTFAFSIPCCHDSQ